MAWREDGGVLTTSRDLTVGENAVAVDDRPDAPQSSEALIEEARQRARRRRLWTLLAVVTVVIGVIAGFTFTGGSGGARPKAITSIKAKAKHPVTSVQKKASAPTAPKFCGGSIQTQFINGSDGWVLNGSGKVFATTDQGKHWTTSYSGPDCMSSVDFLNSSDGWALTSVEPSPDTPCCSLVASSIILRTTNGGHTWVTLLGQKGPGYLSIDMETPTTGWAVTTGGHLLYTVDGGAAWQSVPSPGQVGSVCSDSAGTWLSLTNGDIYSQTDGSASWTQSLAFSQVPVPEGFGFRPAQPFAAPRLACSAKTVWVVFTFGCGAGNCWDTVERSLDGGSLWGTSPQYDQYYALGGATSATDAWFVGGNINVGPTQSLVTTTDAGATFHVLTIDNGGPLPDDLGEISFASSTQGWAIVGRGQVIETRDAGKAWRAVGAIPGF
jgi:photosystem II stability/assembly factor-like uncharacterized protein